MNPFVTVNVTLQVPTLVALMEALVDVIGTTEQPDAVPLVALQAKFKVGRPEALPVNVSLPIAMD